MINENFEGIQKKEIEDFRKDNGDLYLVWVFNKSQETFKPNWMVISTHKELAEAKAWEYRIAKEWFLQNKDLPSVETKITKISQTDPIFNFGKEKLFKELEEFGSDDKKKNKK